MALYLCEASANAPFATMVAPVEHSWEVSGMVKWKFSGWADSLKKGSPVATIHCNLSMGQRNYDEDFYLHPKTLDVVAVWDRDKEQWLNWGLPPIDTETGLSGAAAIFRQIGEGNARSVRDPNFEYSD